MSEFLNFLRLLLDETTELTKAEVVEAQALIKQRFYNLMLRREGPCLGCRMPMTYSGFAQTHMGQGDAWLDKLMAKWAVPVEVVYSNWSRRKSERPHTYNTFKWETIGHYLCEDCATELDELEEMAIEAERAWREKTEQQNRAKDFAIIRGEVQSSAFRRFNTMVRHLTQEEVAALKTAPYKEFLGSLYWEIVRKYVIARKRGRCELCNTSNHLQVHHRTYEHRGEEYNHLEDLVLLCRNCHAKFHDKLG